MINNNYGMSQEQLNDLRIWGKFNRALIQFQNKATPMLFDEIFGEPVGSQLFAHFRLRCENSFIKFDTYLNEEQHNLLLSHVMLNIEKYSI